MPSYHVFFSPKPDVPEAELIEKCHAFLRELKAQGQIESHRLIRITNPASFAELPKFQLIVDYHSQQQLNDSFAFMKSADRISSPPHGSIMESVSVFKVAFSEDV